MSTLAEANSCLSIQPPSLAAGHQPSPGGMSHIPTILSPDVPPPPQAGLKAQPTPPSLGSVASRVQLGYGAWIKQM